MYNNENTFECMYCGDEFFANHKKRCEICEAPVCEDCTKERNILNFNNKCEGCNKIGCLYCINVCPICIENNFLCLNCFYAPGCEYNYVKHMCQKHHDEKCIECKIKPKFKI